MNSTAFLVLALALRDQGNNNSSLRLSDTTLFLVPGLPPVARAIGVINLGRKLDEQSVKLAGDLATALEKGAGKLDGKAVSDSPELSGVLSRLPEDRRTAIIKLAANASRG
jgi:hypothetical protein